MEPIDLSKLNKQDLLAKCKELNITTSKSKKADLIQLINNNTSSNFFIISILVLTKLQKINTYP